MSWARCCAAISARPAVRRSRLGACVVRRGDGARGSVDRIADPEIGDRVVKSGRTTAVTRGRAGRIEVNTKMSYPDGVSAVVGGFEIGIDEDARPPEREISRGGESGAAWLAVARGKPTGGDAGASLRR